MSVELEMAKVGLYFHYKGVVTRIQEAHSPFLCIMRHDMDPILLENKEFFALNFSSVRDSAYGEFERFSEKGRRMALKKSSSTPAWTIGFGNEYTDNEIMYVHELQEIWLAIYREVLRRRGDEPQPLKKMTYTIMPDRELSMQGERTSAHARYSEQYRKYTERLPYAEQLYYLSWDTRYLHRNIRHAIWQVYHPVDLNHVLFEHFNLKWGLKLVAGKDVTSEDTRLAGKWLHHHLLENELKNG